MAKEEKAPAVSVDASRFIMLHGDIDSGNVRDVIKQLFEFNLKDTEKPIYLFVNSYGGTAHEMFALYDVIRNTTAPIYSTILGKSMSAGVLISASGAKGHRKIGKHATLMIHPMFAVNFGNIFEQDDALQEQKRLQQMMEDAYTEVSNLTKKQVKELMEDGRNKYFSAEEAVKMGFADIII